MIELTKSEPNVHFIDITHTNTNVSYNTNNILFSDQDILDILEDGFTIGYLDVTVSGEVSSTSSNGGSCGFVTVSLSSSSNWGNPYWSTSKGSTTYTDHFTRVQIISNESYLAPRIGTSRYGDDYYLHTNAIYINKVSSSSCSFNFSSVSCRIYGLCIG